MTDVLVIAEVGVNHDGKLSRALALVEAAADVGADAVKFQTFSTERLVSRTAEKVGYQIGNSRGKTQFEMLKLLELSTEDHYALSRLAGECGIEFISTPFDLQSLAFLATDIGVKRIKISSGDVTNLPLLHAAGQTGLPLILSTGMATMDEVELGVGAIAHGRATNARNLVAPPSPDAFAEILATKESLILLGDVTLLQCTSEYPSPDHEANLLAMHALRERFSLQVGLSDHSLGSHLCVAATALGARVVEKHLTLDTAADGPDHRASLDVSAFSEMVDALRSTERALGSGIKTPSQKELEHAELVRRGLYAARDLSPGDVVTEADVAILRPQNGVSPARYWDVVGATVTLPIARGRDLCL